jgi:hypothetical protein
MIIPTLGLVICLVNIVLGFFTEPSKFAVISGWLCCAIWIINGYFIK